MARTKESPQPPSRFAFVLIPRFNMMALTAAIEPLRVANYLAPRQLYDWQWLSIEGRPVTASNGMSVDTLAIGDAEGPWDVIFVCGSWDSERYDNATLFKWLRAMDRKGVTLASMDIGAYVIARAGLLAGRQATIHWSFIAGFAEQFPEVSVREQLFTIDKKRMTCAGGTAGLDLMLHEISRRHGQQLALTIADHIMHYPIKPPETSQRHTLGGAQPDLHPKVRAAIALMEATLEEPLGVPEIARKVGVSQRQLERLVQRCMGCSVVRLNQVLRLQYARVLLTNTQMSIREVSAACGFNGVSYFAQAFVKCFGKKPSEYRQAWPDSEPTPSWPGTVLSSVAAKAGRAAPRLRALAAD